MRKLTSGFGGSKASKGDHRKSLISKQGEGKPHQTEMNDNLNNTMFHKELENMGQSDNPFETQ